MPPNHFSQASSNRQINLRRKIESPGKGINANAARRMVWTIYSRRIEDAGDSEPKEMTMKTPS